MISKVDAIITMNSMIRARRLDLQRALSIVKKLKVPRGRIYGQPISILLNL